ncbi:MAG: hypothetical protein ACOCX0_01505 [Bacteroidota bacterium]
MSTFFCAACSLTFEDSQGLKKEYQDYIYGPCWKYIAYCPQCQQECSEKRTPNPGKAKTEVPMGCGGGACHNPGCSRFQ